MDLQHGRRRMRWMIERNTVEGCRCCFIRLRPSAGEGSSVRAFHGVASYAAVY